MSCSALHGGSLSKIDVKTGELIPKADIPGAGATTRDSTLEGLGFRKATPEDVAAYAKKVAGEEARYRVALELKDIAEGTVEIGRAHV